MDHVAIDLGARKSQICVRSADGRDRRGEALGDVGSQAVPGEPAQEPSDRRDLRGGIRRSGGGEGTGPRDADRSGDFGADARRGSATDEDGSARRPSAERGVVSCRSAVGPHPEGAVARAEDVLRDARFAGERSNEGDQHSARMAARPRPSAWEGKQSHLRQAGACAVRCRATGLRGETTTCGGGADSGDRRGRQGFGEPSGAGRNLSAPDDGSGRRIR